MRELDSKVVLTVTYHKAVRTNYLEWRQKNLALAQSLGKGDCVVMISVAKRSIAFAFGFIGVKDQHGIEHVAFAHERVDLGPHEQFDEYMIANYAERAHIKLRGLKKLEEHFKWLKSEAYVSAKLAHKALRSA